MDDMIIWLVSLLSSTLRVSVPLLLAATAGLFSERSGIVDIGLEGKMLAAAFVAGMTSHYAMTQWHLPYPAWIALGAAILTAISFSMLHGFACITHKGDQVISGVAINILAAGLTVLIGVALFQQGGATPALSIDQRFMPLILPFADFVRSIPIIGLLIANVISGHNILVYITFALIPVVAWLLFRTRFGLQLRAVGENPKAVDTAGLSVATLRYKALVINGFFCGIAGAYLAIAQSAGFLTNMTAGKGFLALAALIFGKWKPYQTMAACLLFAFADALQTRLQGVHLLGVGEVPVQFIQMIPYVLTVFILAGFVGKSRAPHAIGKPYVKER